MTADLNQLLTSHELPIATRKGRKIIKQELRFDPKFINTWVRSWNPVGNPDTSSFLTSDFYHKHTQKLRNYVREVGKTPKCTQPSQPNSPSKLCVHEIKTNPVERKKISTQYGKERELRDSKPQEK